MNALSILYKGYTTTVPRITKEVKVIKAFARQHNIDLVQDIFRRKMAHYGGGSILSILGECNKDVLKFIANYQAIADFTDELCERSTNQSTDNFYKLHKAMLNVINLDRNPYDYCELQDQDYNEYLQFLVDNAIDALDNMDIEPVRNEITTVVKYYIDFQAFKHVEREKRETYFKQWNDKENTFDLRWFEFPLASASTICLYTLVSYACKGVYDNGIYKLYFPYMQQVHLMLDYYIDKEEDAESDELNFCDYYDNDEAFFERLKYFCTIIDEKLNTVIDRKFHRLVYQGLIGLYLSEEPFRKLKDKYGIKEILKIGGSGARFLYYNLIWYRRARRMIGI